MLGWIAFTAALVVLNLAILVNMPLRGKLRGACGLCLLVFALIGGWTIGQAAIGSPAFIGERDTAGTIAIIILIAPILPLVALGDSGPVGDRERVTQGVALPVSAGRRGPTLEWGKRRNSSARREQLAWGRRLPS